MSLLTRKRTILAKIEGVYGTDSVPTGTDAMLVKNLNFKPIAASLVNRDLIRPYLGNSEALLAEKYAIADFEVELNGSGTVGLAPAYDCLLRACAFTKSTTLTTITAACTATVVTVTKTAHGYVTGDIITHSGFTDAPKNIAAAITKLSANTYSYVATGASDESSPAAGAPRINSAIVYTPVSAAFESITLYVNVDGVLHKMTGAMGSVEITVAVKQIPTMKFTFSGIYNAPSDAAAPTVDFSGFKIPYVVNTQNTPGFSLFGYSGNMESCSFNIANQAQYITLVGAESVKILDRKPAGTLVFEAPTIASKDFFSLVSANTSGDMTITHGAQNGYKFVLDAPGVLLGDPSYQDSNGVQMLSCPFTAVPVSGNDELSITIK